MVATLSVEELSAGIPRAPALLDNVSFELAVGERVGLIGESGSGKSLTAAALCGLLRPPIALTSGSIRFDGEEFVNATPAAWRRRRGTGIFQIFQSPGTALTPGRRIGPQLAETARRAGADPETVIPPVLEKVALDPRNQQLYPYQLSGGMKQRVLIAMALILRPRILIADEPTTGLDVLTERDILAALNAMIDETGAALLFISHDLRAVRAVAERVLVMQEGRLVEDAPVHELASSPVPAAHALAQAARALETPC